VIVQLQSETRLAHPSWLSYAVRIMKTLTIRLPDVLVAEIERESQARHVSKSDIVRERLSQPQRPAAVASGMSELIGDVLEESWAAEVPAGPPRFSSPKKQRLANLIRAKKLHRR
jgi:hypothetical protein